MNTKNRVIVGILILVLLVAVVIGLEALRGRNVDQPPGASVTLLPGNVPIYLDGSLIAGFRPEDLEKLEKVSFVDAAEGKTQDGWLLRDVLLLYIQTDQVQPETQITINSSSRQKTVQLSWAEVSDPKNMVMFDLSNRGTLKLVSLLEKLDTRDEWIQDADRIEVVQP